MDMKGLDELLENLDRMEKDIDKDVDTIVKNNTIELTAETRLYEKSRFTKGYWTGYTARNTKVHRVGELHYKTLVDSEHAGYLEFGTRYMEPTWFLRDAFVAQKKQFLEDLERLVE